MDLLKKFFGGVKNIATTPINVLGRDINPINQFGAFLGLPSALSAAQKARDVAYQVKPATPKSLLTPTPNYGLGGGYSTSAGDAILTSGLAKLRDIYAAMPSYTIGSFDEALARQSVTQAEDAYYKSKIQDFLDGINLQRSQSKESESRLLSNLTAGTERYMAGEKQQFEIAKENALQSIVGAGRQLSGAGGRYLGQQAALQKTKLADYLAGQAESKAGILEQTKQLAERLALSQKQTIGGYRPETGMTGLGGEYGRQRALDIETGVINRRGEWIQEEE